MTNAMFYGGDSPGKSGCETGVGGVENSTRIGDVAESPDVATERTIPQASNAATSSSIGVPSFVEAIILRRRV